MDEKQAHSGAFGANDQKEIELPTPDGKTDGPRGTVEVSDVDTATNTVTLEAKNPHELAPPSAAPAEAKTPTPVEGTGDSRDTDKVDSLGNEKTDKGLVGPRGANVSPEHLSEAKKGESAAAEQRRLQRGMSSTDFVDSIGNKQGEFRTEPQGLDKHGAKIPDKVTDERVEAPPPMVGPRGHSSPPESFHGKRKA
jgi:hypothetical protein